jgi:CheY-like chemotaxis protein
MNDSPKPFIIATDDDPMILELIGVVLEQLFNADVSTTTDPKKAIRLAFRNVPDLFITDLVKGECTGVDLIKKLRMNRKTMYVPIWVISGNAKKKIGRLAKAAGANLLLSKPFATESLGKHGDNLFKRRRKGRYDYLLDLASETQDVDYKQEMTPTRDGAAGVAKDIIGIANFGGGYLVFGFAENTKGDFRPVGLGSEQLLELEVTTFNKAVREYIDPPHAVKCHRISRSEKTFVAVEIPPANGCLLLANKQNNAAKLYPGRIYSRTTACESAEVRDNYELRRILERIQSSSKRTSRPASTETA